ncbi:hypothetical protein BC830DRAFT_1100580 [Chytriomyces sp. MP71]|nr:hypothetical protein BC830DRAFT_1100580 [Chytriomyces sp. MP71]
MSAILASWLQVDVGLSRRVNSTELDSAFQSGYLFAELLFRLGVIPALDTTCGYVNSSPTNMEASVANFSLLERVLREKLNIKLSPNTAFDLITAKPGGAAVLLYQIKSSVASNSPLKWRGKKSAVVRNNNGAAESVAPVRAKGEPLRRSPFSYKLPPLPNKSDSRVNTPTQSEIPAEAPTPVSYPASPTGDHPANPTYIDTSPRKKYNELEHDFFSETLRLKLRRDHHAGYRPLDHPKLQHPDPQPPIAAAALTAKPQRGKVAEACEPALQTGARAKQGPTAVAIAPKKRNVKELTQTEQAHLMREHERRMQRKQEEETRSRKVARGVIANLDNFERMLHIEECEESEDKQDNAANTKSGGVEPAEIKAFLARKAQLDPIQHGKVLAQMQPPVEEELKRTEEYVGKIRQRKLEDDASRKEREQRRRKIVLGHQQAKEEMERSHLEELLLTKLMRQSKQERRIAEGLMQIRLEKDFMCENRMIREEQYAKRRQKDYEEALEREFIIAERAREEYKRQTELQLAQHFEILAMKAAEKHIKHAVACKEIVHQIVDLSFKIAEYRELNDYEDAPPNQNLMRQWKILFIKGQPLLKTYDLNLDQDRIIPVEQIVEVDGPPEAETNVVADKEVVRGIELVDEEEFGHYINGTGLWSIATDGKGTGRLKNEYLGMMISTIFEIVTPADPVNEQPLMPTVPLRLVMLGKRFAGKKTLARAIASIYNLTVLNVDSLTKEAISEFDDISDAKQRKSVAATHIGSKLQQALLSGGCPSDELLVTLVTEAIKKHSQPEAPGWILLDFPRNRYQAQLLEKELSGYEDPKPVKPGNLKRTPKDKPAPPAKKSSLIAPADQKMDSKVPPAISGIDAVVMLDIDNETAVKRSTGRRLDPVTEIEYHLELNPPPMDQPGIHERLVPVSDEGGQDTQLQYQIVIFEDQEDSLKEWFSRFNNLYVLDAIIPVPTVFQAAKETLKEVVERKEKEKEQQKTIEIPANPVAPTTVPILEESVAKESTPAPAVSITPDAAKKEAEDKKNKLNSGKQRAGSGKASPDKPAEKTNSRGASASTAVVTAAKSGTLAPSSAVDPKKPVNLIGIPDRKTNSIIYVETPDVAFPPLMRNIGTDGRKLPTKELAVILSEEWITLENSYTDTVKFAFRCLRREREIVMRYRHKTKVDFKKYLERPDKKQELVELFQREYNAIEDDLRPDMDAKAELHQRAEDLREKLWDMSDRRREEADSERMAVIDDKYIEDHFAIMTNIYVSMMQAEVDKYVQTKQIVLDFYKDAYGGTVLSEIPKGHLKVPLLSPTAIPPVDTSAIVESLHKKRDIQTIPLKGKATPATAAAAAATKVRPPGSATGARHLPEKAIALGEKDSIPEPESSMFADLDAAISLALTAIQVQKPVHHEEPPAPEKDKKDKKKPAAVVEPVVETKSETETEMPAEYQQLAEAEDQIFQRRLEKIRLMAIFNLTEIRNMGIELYSFLDEIIGFRFQSEMDSIRDLLNVIKEAIETESRLPNEVALNGEKFRVNFSALTLEPEPEPRPESPTEKLISDQFTVLQLLNLGRHFKGLAPKGFLLSKEFAENLTRLATLSPGMDMLPEAYMNIESTVLQQIIVSLDPYGTGFVNWRRFILNQARILPVPTLEQLCALKDSYLCADSFANGMISKQDFMDIPLWFEEDMDDMYMTPDEPPKFNRPAKLKAALFEIFSLPQNTTLSSEQLNQRISIAPAANAPQTDGVIDSDVLVQKFDEEGVQIAGSDELLQQQPLEAEANTGSEEATKLSENATSITSAVLEESREDECLFDVMTFLMGCALDDSPKSGLQKALFVISERGDGAVNIQQLYEIFHFFMALSDETSRINIGQTEDPMPMVSQLSNLG